MAKASTLARNIDKNFLECGICFNQFKDPRGLPCLHAFCCQCLIDWSESCTEDSVTCPLCKQVFPIPDDGIKGFPVHFLVTNLREAVETDKQVSIMWNKRFLFHWSTTLPKLAYFCSISKYSTPWKITYVSAYSKFSRNSKKGIGILVAQADFKLWIETVEMFE